MLERDIAAITWLLRALAAATCRVRESVNIIVTSGLRTPIYDVGYILDEDKRVPQDIVISGILTDAVGFQQSIYDTEVSDLGKVTHPQAAVSHGPAYEEHITVMKTRERYMLIAMRRGCPTEHILPLLPAIGQLVVSTSSSREAGCREQELRLRGYINSTLGALPLGDLTSLQFLEIIGKCQAKGFHDSSAMRVTIIAGDQQWTYDFPTWNTQQELIWISNARGIFLDVTEQDIHTIQRLQSGQHPIANFIVVSDDITSQAKSLRTLATTKSIHDANTDYSSMLPVPVQRCADLHDHLSSQLVTFEHQRSTDTPDMNFLPNMTDIPKLSWPLITACVGPIEAMSQNNYLLSYVSATANTVLLAWLQRINDEQWRAEHARRISLTLSDAIRTIRDTLFSFKLDDKYFLHLHTDESTLHRFSVNMLHPDTVTHQAVSALYRVLCTIAAAHLITHFGKLPSAARRLPTVERIRQNMMDIFLDEAGILHENDGPPSLVDPSHLLCRLQILPTVLSISHTRITCCRASKQIVRENEGYPTAGHTSLHTILCRSDNTFYVLIPQTRAVFTPHTDLFLDLSFSDI
jgi:hypothetical protein